MFDREEWTVATMADLGIEAFDVLVATKGERHPQGLVHVPGHHVLRESYAPGWASAANELLGASRNDAIFMDDDVTILPGTFDLLLQYWERADIFGFTLVSPDRNRVLSSGFDFRYQVSPDGKAVSRVLMGLQRPADLLQPAYVPHVTASLMVIKRRVIESGLRFPAWPGVHFEDVRFTLEAWIKGFKVAYLPGLAIHDMVMQDGKPLVGATKSKEADFEQRRNVNAEHLALWMAQADIDKHLRQGTIPVSPVPII